jgi:hypothetical protein
MNKDLVIVQNSFTSFLSAYYAQSAKDFERAGNERNRRR